jgi:hypothetical protein
VSPAVAISVVALVLAAGGTSFAKAPEAFIAKAVGMNSKQKHEAKSIAKKTIASAAPKLSVLHAVDATNATTATNSTTAATATTATTATNANNLGGAAPSAYEPSAHFIRSGLVKASTGQTVPIASFGPFALTLVCTDAGSGETDAEIVATSTEANSDGYGHAMPVAGTTYSMFGQQDTTFDEDDDNAADFFTPSGVTWIADLTVGVDYFGADCFANAQASPS